MSTTTSLFSISPTLHLLAYTFVPYFACHLVSTTLGSWVCVHLQHKSIALIRKQKMATQALISSSSIASSTEAARQILGGRPFQSQIKKASFVVRATATPPVKVTPLSSSFPMWITRILTYIYIQWSCSSNQHIALFACVEVFIPLHLLLGHPWVTFGLCVYGVQQWNLSQLCLLSFD